MDLRPYTTIAPSDAAAFLEELLTAKIVLAPRKVDKPIILYGAGQLGRMAKHFFDHCHIPFGYVVDTLAAQHRAEEFWHGTKIIPPIEVPEQDKKKATLVVCLVTVPLVPLLEKLRSEGWEEAVPFYDISEAYRDRYPLNNGWFLEPLADTDQRSVRQVFDGWADDVSRAHYLSFLAWRRYRAELMFNDPKFGIDTKNRFFIPEVTGILNDREVLVDGGAHWGSVIEKFLQTTNDRCAKIYAFEPDDLNFSKLAAAYRGDPRIEIFKYALGDRHGEFKFYQGFNFASRLGEGGAVSVEAIALDEMRIPATFVKMHLEGNEFNALVGARQTIRSHRPIITVTVYHNSDGVHRTPLLLAGIAGEYVHYFRLHSWGGTGAVVYSIPKERSLRP